MVNHLCTHSSLASLIPSRLISSHPSKVSRVLQGLVHDIHATLLVHHQIDRVLPCPAAQLLRGFHQHRAAPVIEVLFQQGQHWSRHSAHGLRPRARRTAVSRLAGWRDKWTNVGGGRNGPAICKYGGFFSSQLHEPKGPIAVHPPSSRPRPRLAWMRWQVGRWCETWYKLVIRPSKIMF